MLYVLISLIVWGRLLFFKQINRFVDDGLQVLLTTILIYYATSMPYTTSQDYFAYKRSYLLQVNEFEAGYNLLAHWFFYHGVSYDTFKTVLISLAIILLVISVRRLTKRPLFVLGVYTVVPYFLDAIQIRFLLMTGFVLLGLSFLTKKSILRVVLSIGLIVLGSQFHSSGYFFLLVIPMTLLSATTRDKLIVLLAPIAVFAGLYMRYVPSGRQALLNGLATVLSDVIGRTTSVNRIYTFYTAGSVSQFLVMLILSILLLFVAHKYYQYQRVSGFKSEEFNLVQSALILLLILIPLISTFNEFSRLLRIVFIFAIIMFANTLEDSNKKQFKSAKILHQFLAIGVVIVGLGAYEFYGAMTYQQIPIILKFEQAPDVPPDSVGNYFNNSSLN